LDTYFSTSKFLIDGQEVVVKYIEIDSSPSRSSEYVISMSDNYADETDVLILANDWFYSHFLEAARKYLPVSSKIILLCNDEQDTKVLKKKYSGNKVECYTKKDFDSNDLQEFITKLYKDKERFPKYLPSEDQFKRLCKK